MEESNSMDAPADFKSDRVLLQPPTSYTANDSYNINKVMIC